MNISIRLEGGVGDHLLANRFVHAIKEKYPQASLEIFSDTEGNHRQISLLKKLWPSIYKDDNTHVMTHRKNKDFSFNSSHGSELYPAHPKNIAEEYLEIFQNSDIFYNLCIDNLEWLDHDYDWLRWFYFFPRPEITPEYDINLPERFIACHLFARPDSGHNLDRGYVRYLLEVLSAMIKSHKIVVITTDEHKAYYDDMPGDHEIITPDIYQCFNVSSRCDAFIGIDSGIRYMPYHFGKPTFVFSHFCNDVGDVAYSHLIRWILFKDWAFPMNFNPNAVKERLKVAVNKKYGVLAPETDLQTIDNIIIKRKL